MSTGAPDSNWEQLLTDVFVDRQTIGGVKRAAARGVLKAGRPFLLLPMKRRPAAATLSLYPAQTARARAARWLLGFLLNFRVRVAQEVSIPFSPGATFVRFLASLAGGGGFPQLGMLAGNPIAGQRLLFLVFDGAGRAVAAVKTGIAEQSRALVKQEEQFLETVPRPCTGIPVVRARFESERVRAMVLDFFPGAPPRGRREKALGRLLESWVQDEPLRIAWSPRWLSLVQVAGKRPWFDTMAQLFGQSKLRQVIEHGDLAPWNIRVSPEGVWTALDWERGELVGIPGWDWFHYILQPEILVKRTDTAGLINRVERMLRTRAFRSYAARAGIGELGQWLVLAYLLYMVEVIKPAQGRDETAELLEALLDHWGKLKPKG